MKKVLLVLIMMFVMVTAVYAGNAGMTLEDLKEIQESMSEHQKFEDWQDKTYILYVNDIAWTEIFKIVKYNSYMIVIQKVATGTHIVLFNYEYITLVEVE